MVGFADALDMIFLAQLPHMVHVPWLVISNDHHRRRAPSAPANQQGHPAPRAAIVALTGSALTAINVPIMGDEGELPDSRPSLSIREVPLTCTFMESLASGPETMWRRCLMASKGRSFTSWPATTFRLGDHRQP